MILLDYYPPANMAMENPPLIDNVPLEPPFLVFFSQASSIYLSTQSNLILPYLILSILSIYLSVCLSIDLTIPLL